MTPPPQRRPPWLMILLGALVVSSFTLMWANLPAGTSLRSVKRHGTTMSTSLSEQARLSSRPLVSQNQTALTTAPPDVYSLVEQHRKNNVKSQQLHIDDLVQSDSYEQWAPMIVSRCMHGMNQQSAPCIKEAHQTNMIEAQELIYPAFKLRLPHFASTAMRDKWLSQGYHVARMRVSEDLAWAEYPTFDGQNMVFKDAVFQGNPPPDVWSDESCVGGAVSHASFLNESAKIKFNSKTAIDTLIVATSPDSWSFQHFIDRVAVVWSQAQLVIPTKKKSETVIVSGKTPRDEIVNEIYKMMVGRHLHEVNVVSAKQLIFSCRAPLIHPYTTQRISENILHTLPPASSQTQRNVILFLSRGSNGGAAANGGRDIQNEPEIFKHVEAMLKSQGRSETLQYFRHSDFKNLKEVATFMRSRVKMMIGPHGAAFYNSRFALPETGVIEIIPEPDKFFCPCFWEQARMLGQDYSAHVGKVLDAKNNMLVEDVQAVVNMVRERLNYLDKSYQKSDALDHSYVWRVESEKKAST